MPYTTKQSQAILQALERRESGGAFSLAVGEVCFLLRCQSCGRMEHLDCPQLQALYHHIAAEHGFRVDPRQTVLTGLCGPCAGQEAGHGEG